MSSVKTYDVYTDEDPYLTNVLVQLVTKAGHYTDKSMIRFLLNEGQVKVDANVVKKPETILQTGLYSVQVRNTLYVMNLHRSILE